MQRLFVALELPAAVCLFLRARQKEIPGVRWVSPGNLHLTVRFIGEVSLEQAAAIKMELKAVRAKAFPLHVKGLGFFNTGSQAVLWAGIEPSTDLFELKRQVDDILKCYAGIRNSNERFLPHITLGRMKPIDLKALRVATAEDSAAISIGFVVKTFTIFKSLLVPSGVVHTIEEEYLLGME